MKSEKEILEFIVENKKIHKAYEKSIHGSSSVTANYRLGMVEALEWVLAERVEVVHK